MRMLAAGWLWLVPALLWAQDDAMRGGAMTPDGALEAWREGRAVVLMRHALAPGTGDPAGFDVDDCGTQRNLSASGRAQARAIGERLRAVLGNVDAEVYSSPWCRCLDTARLLDVGDVEVLAPLGSFYRERGRAEANTRALTAWLDARLATEAPPAVLVTHQVNITALTGRGVASGEMFVVAPEKGTGTPAVLARIATPANGR